MNILLLNEYIIVKWIYYCEMNILLLYEYIMNIIAI